MTRKALTFYRDPRGNSGKFLKASEIPFMLSMEWNYVCGLRHREIVELLKTMLNFVVENDSRQLYRLTDPHYMRAVGMCHHLLTASPADPIPSIGELDKFRSTVEDVELNLIVMIMKAKNLADHDAVRDSSGTNHFYLAIQKFGEKMTEVLKKRYGDDWIIIAELYQDIMISRFG